MAERRCTKCKGRMPAYRPRIPKDGELLCEGCANGREGRPLTGSKVSRGTLIKGVAPFIRVQGVIVKVEHQANDGVTIMHCPFCGSGQVIGTSSGTIDCDFCHTSFLVQVQPQQPTIPQTIDGQPFQDPSMPPATNPPASGEPDSEAAESGDDDSSFGGDNLSEKPKEGETGGDDPKEKAEGKADKGIADLNKESFLVTDQGVALPADKFMKYVALRATDNFEETLAEIRREG